MGKKKLDGRRKKKKNRHSPGEAVWPGKKGGQPKTFSSQGTGAEKTKNFGQVAKSNDQQQSSHVLRYNSMQ